MCEKDPKSLNIDFVANLTNVKTVFSILNERCSFNKNEAKEYEDEKEDEKETDAATHFLRIQKDQLIDSMQHLERYANTLPVFGYNSGRYDINLIKSQLIPYLINEKEIETSVI